MFQLSEGLISSAHCTGCIGVANSSAKLSPSGGQVEKKDIFQLCFSHKLNWKTDSILLVSASRVGVGHIQVGA